MRLLCVITCFFVIVVYSICSTFVQSQNPKHVINEESIPIEPDIVHIDKPKVMKVNRFHHLERSESCFHNVRFVLTTDKQVYRPEETWFFVIEVCDY